MMPEKTLNNIIEEVQEKLRENRLYLTELLATQKLDFDIFQMQNTAIIDLMNIYEYYLTKQFIDYKNKPLLIDQDIQAAIDYLKTNTDVQIEKNKSGIEKAIEILEENKIKHQFAIITPHGV